MDEYKLDYITRQDRGCGVAACVSPPSLYGVADRIKHFRKVSVSVLTQI